MESWTATSNGVVGSFAGLITGVHVVPHQFYVLAPTI